MTKKVILPLVATTILAGEIFFTSCEKDALIENKTNGICTLSDWYHVPTDDSTTYPFVLSLNNDPFQYAVYQNDMQNVFDNVETLYLTNNGQNIYFVFSLNENENLLYYGMVSGLVSNGGFQIDTSGYFQSIDNMDEESYLHIPTKKITTTDKVKFDKWVAKKLQRGYTVTEWKEGDQYMAVAQRLPNN